MTRIGSRRAFLVTLLLLVRVPDLVPDRDIQVVFSGIRPGEKLQAELVCVGEVAAPSAAGGSSVSASTSTRSTRSGTADDPDGSTCSVSAHRSVGQRRSDSWSRSNGSMTVTSPKTMPS